MARKPKIDQRAIEKHLKDIAKGYERAARRNPIRVPIQTDASPEGASVASRDTIEGNPVLARLLKWLDGQAQLNPSHYVDVTRFVEEQQLHGEDASVLAFELEQRDLVNIARTMGGTPDVHLSDAGRVAVHRLKNLQKDRAARLRYTMDAFLRWLFDTAGDQTPVDSTLFLTTPGSSFAGAGIPGTDVHQALAYLVEHDFIERLDTDPATVAITPRGVSCALSGGSVQDHTNQPRTGTTYNNYLPNAQGVIIGEQQTVTQNNTAGIDPSAFVQLAGYVGQISATLGMPERDRVELERVARELHAEATSPNPEPGRMRQFATQVKDKLLEAGTTMAATVGVQMAEQALGTLMQ
ncbi:hypothetical protein AB0D27_37225 [Streptomyces sp. NPDC048415]|uniref:hypothetical protein n=1 Tax=Streptomyces sp. NPDC048415 TaxID=3154822 RepID=UPI00341A6B69